MTRWMPWPLVLALLSFGSGASLMGCSSDSSEGEARCRVGVMDETGRCVRPSDTSGDTSEDPSDTDSDSDTDTTGPCEEETFRCEGHDLAECVDGAWNVTPCEGGMRCVDQATGPACSAEWTEPCEPGTFFGCASPTTTRQCASDGMGAETVNCEGETPFCLSEDGGCSARACIPETRFCDGEDVRECDADGLGSSILQVCTDRCSQGQCATGCLVPDGKGAALGCEFWAVWLDQVGLASGPSYTWGITAANPGDATVEVDVESANGTPVRSFTLAPGALEKVNLPIPSPLVRGTRQARDTWRIRADGAVTVHQFNPSGNELLYSNDASLLLPTTAAGTQFLYIGWPSFFSPASPLTGGQNNGALIAIVATSPGVSTVEVRPSVAIEAGGGVPAIAAGATSTLQLDYGDVVHLRAVSPGLGQTRDLSGSVITADQPISVFATHQCANVPDNNTVYCDHLQTQLTPTSSWGDRYVLGRFMPRGNAPDIFRVIALDDGTTLQSTPSISGVDGRTLSSGEVIQFETTQDLVLEGNKRFAVVQLMVGSNFGCREVAGDPQQQSVGCAIPRQSTCPTTDVGIGDPAITLAVPERQFVSSYVFLVPDNYRDNHITVVAREGVELTLDGEAWTPQSTPIGATGWVAYRGDVTAGTYTLDASSPVGLTVHGYDCEVSYAYPGGMNLDRE